jgi:hypothetical protein
MCRLCLRHIVYNHPAVCGGYLHLTFLGSWTHPHVVPLTFRTRSVNVAIMKIDSLSSLSKCFCYGEIMAHEMTWTWAPQRNSKLKMFPFSNRTIFVFTIFIWLAYWDKQGGTDVQADFRLLHLQMDSFFKRWHVDWSIPKEHATLIF